MQIVPPGDTCQGFQGRQSLLSVCVMAMTLTGNRGLQGPQEVKSLMATAVTSARLELAALPLEDAAFAAVAEGNHKLALTEGLLQVGAWPQASRMLVWLSGLGAPAAAHAGVRAALCQLLAQRLEPFHAWLHPHGLRGGPSQVLIPLRVSERAIHICMQILPRCRSLEMFPARCCGSYCQICACHR